MTFAPNSLTYERRPEAIYEASFEEIASLPELRSVPDPMRALATRLVHTAGDPQIVDRIRASKNVAGIASEAFLAGADIYCDTETVRSGIMRRLLPETCRLHCAIADKDVREHALRRGMTRSAAQFDLWGARLNGQIVAVGNAPTALFRLLEIIDAGIARPKVIVAFPVGFVGAAESKDELHTRSRGIAYVTLLGRRGGSAMAQAAVNALAGGLGR